MTQTADYSGQLQSLIWS